MANILYVLITLVSLMLCTNTTVFKTAYIYSTSVLNLLPCNNAYEVSLLLCLNTVCIQYTVYSNTVFVYHLLICSKLLTSKLLLGFPFPTFSILRI